MQKEDLKSLVTQMYEELIENIDTQDEATKEQVVTYLYDAASTIASIKDSDIDSTEHAKLAFTNTYKEIVDQSLSSFRDSNQIFEEIAQIHQNTMSECSKIHIDLPSMTEKFKSVQIQMNNEVERANSIITELTIQVKELERNSNLDSLTKVFNRRALTTYLNNLCDKGDIPYNLHLLVLDIDDFKIINDTYGHIAGDKILIFIANMLRRTLRDGDKVFRYGGEEFVIVLNRITPEVCLEITNRILALVRNNRLIYKGESLNVTMSIGATKYFKGDTPDSIIDRADKALYKSKSGGKNQMNTETIPDGN